MSFSHSAGLTHATAYCLSLCLVFSSLFRRLQSREVLNKEGFRQDGRRAQESRGISVKFGVLERVDGSCLYQQGLTKVMASVIGPAESKNRGRATKAVVECEFMTAPFASVDRKPFVKGTRANKEKALIIQQTFENVIQLELFPQSHIQINVMVLQNAGGVLACAINAVSAALLHAAVPMQDIITASTGSVVDTIPILDLNMFERNIIGTQITLAVEHFSGGVATVQSESRISIENMEMAMDLATSGCKIIVETVRESLKNYWLGADSTSAI